MSKNLHVSFAAMTGLAERQCISTLLTLKVENKNNNNNNNSGGGGGGV
jgi:hypothetical protein